MTRKRLAGIAIGIIGVVVIAALVDRVGSVAIRRVQPDAEITLSVVEPLLPGVNSVVRWDMLDTVPNQRISLHIRSSRREYPAGEMLLHDRSASVAVPCDVNDRSVSLVMTYANSREVIAWKDVALLEPGMDCVR